MKRPASADCHPGALSCLGWFSGGDKDKDKKASGNGQPASNGKTRTATNAPRHWPQVAIDTWPAEDATVTYLTIGATLTRGSQALGSGLAFHQERLYDDGRPVMPILMTEGEQRTAVYAYPRVDAKTPAHFSGVRSLLRQREGINAVYYAPEPIQRRRQASSSTLSTCRRFAVRPSRVSPRTTRCGGRRLETRASDFLTGAWIAAAP